MPGYNLPLHHEEFRLKSFALKIATVVGLILAVAFLISLPAKTYGFGAATNSSNDGFNGYSGTETNSNGEKFNWSLDTSTQLFPYVARYTPLELRIKANLGRPAGEPPARIEIYEGTAAPNTDLTLVGVMTYNPQNPATQDYHFTVPRRSGGEGLLLQFKSNAFQVKGDSRQLGFIFFDSEVSLPQKHLFYLFWPNPYGLACIILLAVVAAWTLRAGFSWLETSLFGGLAGFVMLTMASSTYQHGWWLLVIAVGLGAVFWWEGQNIRKKFRWGVGPLMLAAGLVIAFFLFSGLSYEGDIVYYTRWSAAIHQNGLWMYDPKFNYLPLIGYIIWFYNLAAYPFNFHDSYLAWRVFASLAFLAVIFIVHLLLKEFGRETTTPKETGRRGFANQGLLLLAFNAAFFYNPTLWGQSDIFPVLGLVIALWLVYRRQPLLAGIAIGLLLVSKAQAWFLLPLLAWWLLQRCGWKKTLAGLSLGAVVALALSAAPYGLDINNVIYYFNQPEFTGIYTNNNPNAANFNYLIITNQRTPLPVWMSLTGTLVVMVTLALLVYFSRGKERSLKQGGFAAGYFAFSCFVWLIKMKERYLIYSLPFLGIGATQEKRLVKPFLALSWLQLLQLTISMFQEDRSRSKTLADNFFWWSVTLNRVEVQWLLSLGTMILWGYLLFLYLRNALKKPAPAPSGADPQANSPQLVTP
ncbi:MAG: DUF2029 domain-containing protein [Chloroflexi bacterium]|nr:DUF2029 domain-containing protein [Chloroflexota bacterium]